MAARRRRTRASQDSEEDEESGSGVDSSGSGSKEKPPRARSASSSTAVRRPEPVVVKAEAESECESEDGIEGDAILSDYESAEENGSQNSEGEEDYSEEEPPKENLKPRVEEKDVDETSAKVEGKTEQRGTINGERQSGDGQESTEPVENKAGKKIQKPLDDDEDRKNPAYIPRKGLFFEHDLRGQSQEEEIRPKGHQRKLWKDEGRWVHDRFREEEQAPKSREELIALYGYDIRSENNSDAIRPRRTRKPRFGSPPRREQNWPDEKPNRLPRQRGPSSVPPTRPYIARTSPGPGRGPPLKTFQRTVSYKESRTNFKPRDGNYQHNSNRTSSGDFRQGQELRVSSDELSQERDTSPVAESEPVEKSSPVKKEETVSEIPAPVAVDTVQPVQDKPVEKKSYSRVRRTRIKAGDAGKPADEIPQTDLLAPVPEQHVQVMSPPPTVKTGSWERQVDSSVGGLEHEMAQMNLSGQNWTPGQPSFIQPQELRGIPNQIHMGGGPPQYNRIEEMGVQGGRAKRYSRQRPVPEPAPMHINIMEQTYYDPIQYPGPIYTHPESPAQLPPQGMMVQTEMHLPPHPGLHPHQSPTPMTNPGLYAPPVSISPGQPPPPPPQQLLAPTFFPPPGVMNFGSPTYPYAPGALPPPPPPPPHLYPNTQTQAQVFGGVTYYNTVQQQAQPKPSPPRRTSQPVTIKPPPPEDGKIEKQKEKNST